MKSVNSIFLIAIIATLIFSCKQNPLKVDISNIEAEVKVVNFGEELLSLNGKDTLETIVELSNSHPDFFNLYTYRIIKIGGINDEYFPELIKTFINQQAKITHNRQVPCSSQGGATIFSRVTNHHSLISSRYQFSQT